jgi:hypothetical protein
MRTIVAIGSLVVFVVLTVIMLKHHRNEIPRRDVYSSFFLLAGSVVASAISMLLKRMRKDTKKKLQNKTPAEAVEASKRRAEFTRLSSQLMKYEVLFALLLPWIALRASKSIQIYCQVPMGLVEHVLVPHLYFFQAQIAAEAILLATHHDELLFPYTWLANALRALPLATGILRSIVAIQTMFYVYNPFHWVLVVGLPAAATALWLYSSLIFLPLHWYPVLLQQGEVGGGKGVAY